MGEGEESVLGTAGRSGPRFRRPPGEGLDRGMDLAVLRTGHRDLTVWWSDGRSRVGSQSEVGPALGSFV